MIIITNEKIGVPFTIGSYENLGFSGPGGKNINKNIIFSHLSKKKLYTTVHLADQKIVTI